MRLRHALLLAASLPGFCSTLAAQRALAPDDLLRRQMLGQITPSPRGDAVALVVRRGSLGQARAPRPQLGGYDLSDLWIVPVPGGEPRRVTDGAREGTGVLLPVWSPDGERVAFMSTEGNDNLRPYVWTRGGGARRLSERGLNVDAQGRIQWIDGRRVLLALLAQGERPELFAQDHLTRETATEAWARQAAGREPTASVLEGGVPHQPSSAPGQLVVVDAATGRTRVLAEGRFLQVWLSPDRRQAAVLEQVRWTAPGIRGTDAGRTVARLGVVAVDGGPVRWIEGLGELVRGATTPLAWSPAGDALALVARPDSGDAGARLYVASLAEGAARSVGGGALAAEEVRWGAGGLRVRGRWAGQGSDRAEWWAVGADGSDPRPVTRGLASTPGALFDLPCPGRSLALAAGGLWSVGAEGEPRNLTGDFAPQLRAVAWPSASASRAPEDALIARTAEGTLVRVQPRGCEAEIQPLAPAPEGANLAAYLPASGHAVFNAERRDGTWLWSGEAAAGRWAERIRLNAHFAELEVARRTLVEYRGGDGDPLTAQVVHPRGHQPGQRHPAVVWVYPNLERPEIADTAGFRPGNFVWWQPELLAARGYSVVIPTFSLAPDEQPRDMYFEVFKDVLPAVQAAVDAGVVDPERVGVFGESFGGWAVFALITQTDRFKAAVATLGQANLASAYGTFHGGERYGADLQRWTWRESLELPYYYNLHAAPAENLWRYLRNSPIHYMDRVNTPVLIAQGDMDSVPLAQGEEVFTTLYRMGKRVRFVRYWGEGHDFASPANVRHLWNEVGAWFDAHLKP